MSAHKSIGHWFIGPSVSPSHTSGISKIWNFWTNLNKTRPFTISAHSTETFYIHFISTFAFCYTFILVYSYTCILSHLKTLTLACPHTRILAYSHTWMLFHLHTLTLAFYNYSCSDVFCFTFVSNSSSSSLSHQLPVILCLFLLFLLWCLRVKWNSPIDTVTYRIACTWLKKIRNMEYTSTQVRK